MGTIFHIPFHARKLFNFAKYTQGFIAHSFPLFTRNVLWKFNLVLESNRTFFLERTTKYFSKVLAKENKYCDCFFQGPAEKTFRNVTTLAFVCHL